MRLLLVVFLLAFGIASGSAQEWRNWQSKHNLDHPLVGLILLPEDMDSIDNLKEVQSLVQKQFELLAVGSPFVLIGEQHDNPDHHRIQAWILNTIAKHVQRTSVILEMVPKNYGKQLSQLDLQSDPQLNEFAKRLDWEKRGWPSWEIYRPLVLTAAHNNMRLVAGNLDQDTVRQISKSGIKVLPPQQISAFGLTKNLSNQHQASLDAELKSSHCDLLPDSMIPTMRIIQRARDGSLADAMVLSSAETDAILIAGNGHVRKDRGVPAVLRQHQFEGRPITDRLIFSISLIEVEPGLNSPTDYDLINEQGNPLYDAVIFTPKTNITDHCAALRKQFEKKKSE